MTIIAAEQIAGNEVNKYGAVARGREIAKLLDTPGGLRKRKDALKHAAYKLGQLIPGGWLARDDVEDALWHAARTLNIPADDCRRLIDKGIQEGMATPREPRRLNLSIMVELAEERYDFSGRTGATDWAVYMALVRLAQDLGNFTFDHSCRQIGEKAGLGGMHSKPALTVSRSCRRLVAGGLLSVLWRGRGAMSTVWQLTDPSQLLRQPCRVKGSIMPYSGEKPLAYGVPNATAVAMTAHPAWDRKGFGPTRQRIYGTLLETALTVSELAQEIGLSRGTVHRNLPLLEEHGMVRRIVVEDLADHWTAVVCDLDEVADLLGVLDVGHRRKQAHKKQTQDWRSYLRTRQAGGDPKKKVSPIIGVVDPDTGVIVDPYTGEIVPGRPA